MNIVNQKHWYKSWWGVALLTLLILVGALFFASVFYVADQVRAIQAGQHASFSLSDTTVYQNTEGEGNFWLGSNQPKITIVEFADFACPYSKSSFPKIRELADKYRDRVKFIYRDFPYIAAESIDLAMAARCAGEQGLFWKMHDKLYELQGIKTADELTGAAQSIGADSAAFRLCLEGKKYSALIKKNILEANKFDIQGTPTWFINGRKVAGDLPATAWEEIIKKFSK